MTAQHIGLQRLPKASQWIRTILRYQSEHPALKHVLDVVERLQDRPYRTNALLLGEPGTGQEGLARALHALMHPDEAPFAEVSLGGRDLHEASVELFGSPGGPGLIRARARRHGVHGRGSDGFARDSSATARGDARSNPARGRTRRTRRDQITVVGEHGSAISRGLCVRAARHDLYWRLARVVLTLPPLRERREDIARMAVWIGSRVLERTGSDAHLVLEGESDAETVVLTRGAQEVLVAHDWPGNFRELDAVLERAMLLYGRGRRIEAEHVRRALSAFEPARAPDRKKRFDDHRSGGGSSVKVT